MCKNTSYAKLKKYNELVSISFQNCKHIILYYNNADIKEFIIFKQKIEKKLCLFLS